jgi:hypothetical protein
VTEANQNHDELEPHPPLTELQIFFIKVATVTGAVAFLMFASFIFVAAQIDELALLKGGGTFWRSAEDKLYAFVDQPDLPEAKKAKIIAALKKISERYRPYVNAIEGPSEK